jgi:hypothetical protein
MLEALDHIRHTCRQQRQIRLGETHLGVGLVRRGNLETNWFASVSIPLDSMASRSGTLNRGTGGAVLGCTPIVESESYSRIGLCVVDKGFFGGEVSPAIGVLPSLDDSVLGGTRDGPSTEGGCSVVGVVVCVEGSDSSQGLRSFSSASDTVSPAALRSSELKTS